MAGNTAAAFLRKLRPSGPWVLTSIHPDKGWITTITAKTSDEVGEFVCKWNGKRNLYYSVNPTRTDMTKKASKADIGTIEYLLADLDPKDNETVRDAKARYIWALQHSKPVSTATVDSGNGIQALWRLATPVGLANGNKELIKDVENRVAKLIEGLGGEAGTQNIDRILRLPGTINLPNAKKRKAGRVACPAKLLNFNCVTCKLSDFPLDAPDRLENAPQTEPDETIEAEDDGNDRGLNYIEMGLPDELMTLIRDGVPEGERSDQFHHAVKWLKDEGIRPKIIIKILKRYPDGIAAKYLEGKQDRVATEAKRVYGKPDAPKDDSKAKDNKDDANTKDAKAKGRLILSSEEFTRGFVPPDYLWDGILLRGYVYSLTARTGEGKTAIMLALSASIALGKDFSGREVAQGKVLYFAGENPNDVCMRWIAMAEHKDFDADFIDVHFISGTFDIGELEQKIRDEVDALGGVTFVVIDTSPAYFQGDNENDAVQMIAHAEMLRRLESLSGRPTILAATHPVKNASNDNLVPRGGGSFLNAMDGNLSCFKVDMLVTMHHQGKFRGVDFEPMTFELEPVIARKLIDSKGRHIPTVIARDLSKDDQREKNREARSDEDAILVLLFRRTKSTSLNEIASELGWFVGSDNHPNKSKVQRLINDLKRGNKADRLVEVDRDGAKLTKKGSTSAAAAAGTAAAAAAAAAMEAATSPEQGTKPML